MKYIKYIVEDSTGAGEDGFLILPEWMNPPGVMRVYVGEDQEPLEVQIDPGLNSTPVEDEILEQLQEWASEA